MARTTFIASFTRITSAWVDKIDRVVVNALNEFRTPLDIRRQIGASSNQAFEAHKEDSISPHGDDRFLLDSHKIRVVKDLPFFGDPGKIYINTGGGKNPRPYVLDNFTDSDATLIAVHNPNLQYLSGNWEVFVPSTGIAGVAFIQDNAARSTQFDLCLVSGPSSGLVARTAFVTGQSIRYPGVIIEATHTPAVPFISGYQIQILPKPSTAEDLAFIRLVYWAAGVATEIATADFPRILSPAFSLQAYKVGNQIFITADDMSFVFTVAPSFDITGLKYGFGLNDFAVQGTIVDNFSLTELI
jgi:hypothetical protein